MRKLYVIGIGAGNPEQITIQAIKAMNAVDVFFFMDKVMPRTILYNSAKKSANRYIDQKTYRIVRVTDPERDPAIESYTERVEAWHQQEPQSTKHSWSTNSERMIAEPFWCGEIPLSMTAP